MGNNLEAVKTLDFVETFFGFKISNKSRKRPMVEARMMYAKLMKRYTRSSLSDIGRYIEKDHATIIHYLDNFTWLKKTDQSFSSKFDLLTDMYEDFRKAWFDDEVYDDKKKIQFLEVSLNKTTEDKTKYENYFKRIERLESIIQLIEERTPKGEEEYVEAKINRMFNSIVFKP
jgi:hypothetical protein